MRLWHQDLIERLPRQQLLGQHRECAALRGRGWGKSHATVNYVFETCALPISLDYGGDAEAGLSARQPLAGQGIPWQDLSTLPAVAS